MLSLSFQLFDHLSLSNSMEFQNKLVNIYQPFIFTLTSYYIDDSATYR